MAPQDKTILGRDRGATVPSVALANVLRAVDGRASADAMCEALGIDPALPSQPDTRVPYRQLAELFDVGAWWTADPWFGLRVGTSVDKRSFGLIGYLTQTAATLLQAFDVLACYLPLWTTSAQFLIERSPSGIEVVWTYADPAEDRWRHDCEMTIAAAIGIGDLFRAGRWRPRAVHFRHPAPRDTSGHTRLLRAPVRFGMPDSRFLCDAAACAAPIATADPELHALLRDLADRQLAARPAEPSALGDVAAAIVALLPGGDVRISRVARRLGIGTRTLQRRLIAQGATFRDLLHTVRRDRATRDLVESDRSISEIATRLGYGAASELHRAFHRWTGVAPTTYRQQHRARG